MHISVCANEAGSLEDFVDPPMLRRGCRHSKVFYMQNKSGTGSSATSACISTYGKMKSLTGVVGEVLLIPQNTGKSKMFEHGMLLIRHSHPTPSYSQLLPSNRMERTMYHEALPALLFHRPNAPDQH